MEILNKTAEWFKQTRFHCLEPSFGPSPLSDMPLVQFLAEHIVLQLDL